MDRPFAVIEVARRFRYPLCMKYLILFILTLAGIYWLSEQEPSRVVASDDIYVVDGDTIKIDGESYRLMGFDTPETYRSECASELALGNQATARLRELIDQAAKITMNVEKGHDKYGRWLATLAVDQKDVGDLLINEGLARRYTGGTRRAWCSG